MIKISLLKFYLITFILSISFYSVGNTENEFPLDPAITYGKLENGFTYYIRENQTPKDKVSIKLIIKAGSIMEEEKQLGLAHLLEHMAFNGSKNFPKRKIDEYMSSIGLNLGSHYNASTGFLETSYDYEIPTKNDKDVEIALKILTDISKNLSLEPEAFERERKIVEEEWRRDIGGSQDYVNEFHKVLFKNSRLNERKPIGTLDIIQNFKYQDVIDYYQKWYRPQLMGLFVIGDIEVDEIEKLIKDNFGTLENLEKLQIPDYKIPNYPQNQFFVYQDDTIESLSFSIFEKNDFKKTNNFTNYREAIVGYLTQAIFSRRIDELTQENNQRFIDAYITDFSVSDNDEFRIVATTLKEDQIIAGIEDFLIVIEQIKKHGFLNSELELAKKNHLEYLKRNLTENQTRSSDSYINEYQRHFLFDEMISGSAKEVEYTSELLPSITVEDLKTYFNSYIKADNQIISIKAPEYIKSLPSRDEIDQLLETVSQKDIKPYQFTLKKAELIKEDLKGSKIIKRKKFPKSDVHQIILDNGAKILLKQTDFKKDEINFSAFSSGGYSTANLDQLYSAKFTDDILGSADIGDLTVLEKANLYSEDAIDVIPYISEESEGVNGYSNNENLETMFKLLYLNFTDLRIKQSHVDRFKKIKINKYKIDKESPKHEYYLEFRKKTYQDHPRTQYATDKSFEQIDLMEVQNFYKDRFIDGGDFDYIFVGDFKFEVIEPLIEKYIGSLKSLDRNDVFIDHNIRRNQNKEYIEYVEEDPKKATVMRIYNKEFNYSYKEKIKSRLLFSILDKLLFDEVREKDNLVYSISASKYFDQKIPIELMSFYTYFEADPKNVQKIKDKIDLVINKIKTKDFDLQIFKDQKLALKNSYQSSLQSNDFWFNVLMDARQHNLSIERITNAEVMLKSISLNDIAKLANYYFDKKYTRIVQLLAE
jgi:zinc protease